MSFRFPRDARAFFNSIEKPKDGALKFIMFDAYYCSLLIGLDTRRLGAKEDLETDTFLPTYPEDYRNQADIIAALLIDAELDRKAIQPDDKASIEREMTKLIDPTSPSKVSEAGNELLNLYAAAGFRTFQSAKMPPSTVEDFLVAYHSYWHTRDEQTV